MFRILLLPDWLYHRVSKEGLIAQVDDVEALSNIVSPSDVAFYIAMNFNIQEHFGTPGLSRAHNPWIANRFPFQYTEAQQNEVNQIAQSLGWSHRLNDHRIAGSQSVSFEDRITRLFGNDTSVTREEEYGYSVFMANPDTAVIRPVVGDYPDIHERDQALRQSLLRQAFKQMTMEEVAQNTLFREFIEYL